MYAIDGLTPYSGYALELEHEKPFSTASASMQAEFFEAAGWRMQVKP